MLKLAFILSSTILISLIQEEWTLNQDGVTYSYQVSLTDPPKKIEFLMGNYEASARVKYADNIATVGNIQWGGLFNGISVNITLEETIFKKNGKLKPNWESKLKDSLTKSIRSELSYYE